jgi:adenylate cyclase
MKLNFSAVTDLDEPKEIDREHLPKILIVDDEAPNRNVLTGLLQKKYRIDTADSAEQALKLIHLCDPTDNYCAIVSDNIMPGTTGIQMCVQLEQEHHPAPRIIVTGYAELGSVIDAINEAHIFRYITKPLDVPVLLRAVEEAVGHFQMREENGRLMGIVKDMLETQSEMAKVLSANNLDGAFNQKMTPATGEPRRLEVCVLFADVRGFSAFSEQVGASEVIAMLRKLFEPLHNIIYEAGGIVDKHLGDGLMAVFGLSGTSSHQAALNACKKIVDTYPNIQKQLGEQSADLKLSLGLAAGEVVVGMLGSHRRSELAIIGRPANLSARLQEFTKNALGNGPHRDLLGQFPKVMAICDERLLGPCCPFQPVNLPKNCIVRDFPDLRHLGVLSN